MLRYRRTRCLLLLSGLVMGLGACTGSDEDTKPNDSGDLPEPVATVSLIAGNTSTGFVDGIGLEARFNGPTCAEISADGQKMYISDTFNSLIRVLDLPTMEVTTLIGAPQQATVADGIGTDARVLSPRGIAVTPDHTSVYVADGPSIRHIDLASAEITLVAGNPADAAYVDDTGDSARFGYLLHDLVVSEDGETLYVADRSNRVVRAVDLSSFAVTTVAGAVYSGNDQHADGSASEARFGGIGGLSRHGDTLYAADTFNHVLRSIDLTSFEVATVAGQAGSSGTADGSAEVARLNGPQGVAYHDGSLFAAGFDGLLRRINLADGAIETVAGVQGETVQRDGTQSTARLGGAFAPPLIDVERQSLIYFDLDGGVRSVDLADYSVETIAGPRDPIGTADGAAVDARFDTLYEIESTPDGVTWFLADTLNHTIRAVNTETSEVTTVAGTAGSDGSVDGSSGDATFRYPVGLAWDEDQGALLVGDYGNSSIRRIDLASGEVSTLAGLPGSAGSEDGVGADARFEGPWHMALVGRDLYVADYDAATIRRVDVDTAEVSTVAGTAGQQGALDGVGTEARFMGPIGIASNSDGSRLFISDFEALTIRDLDLETLEVRTIAGEAMASGVINGPASEARFNGPSGLELDIGGEALLIVDSGSHVVRRLDLSTQEVSTWMGQNLLYGELSPGSTVSWDEAVFYYPESITLSGDSYGLVSQAAVYHAEP